MAGSGVEIVETAPIESGRWNVVTGFAGPGFVGSTAAMHIVRNMGFKQRAYVTSELIPPMMLIIDGEPTRALRIYGDEREGLLIVVSEALMSGRGCWHLSSRLMEWLTEKGVAGLFFVEGLPFGAPSERPVVLGFSTDRRNLAQFGVRPTEEGVVSGLNACLMEECMRRGLPWTSIFVGVSAPSTIDYGGSAAVIEVLNRIFDLDVDVTPLKRRDEMMRQMAERRMKGEPRGFLGALRRRG